MRSGHEDGAHHARIASEDQRVLQPSNRLRIAAQSLRRNNEEALRQTVATRTDKRAREQPAHAVANNDDPMRRKIVVAGIDHAHGAPELLAQPERVQQDRCAGTIIEVQNWNRRAMSGLLSRTATNMKKVTGVDCRPCTNKIGLFLGSYGWVRTISAVVRTSGCNRFANRSRPRARATHQHGRCRGAVRDKRISAPGSAILFRSAKNERCR